jgi:hypothetical protein
MKKAPDGLAVGGFQFCLAETSEVAEASEADG